MVPEVTGTRIMAIDYGEKRVGIAISDELCRIAQGHSVIDGENKDFLIDSISKLILEYGIKKIVIGLPRNMDGSYGFQSQKVLDFKDLLVAKISKPVELLDERLTTVQAKKISHQQGMKKGKRKNLMDIISAALILENYLSILDNSSNSE
jgi:putative holliday junction resolvase